MKMKILCFLFLANSCFSSPVLDPRKNGQPPEEQKQPKSLCPLSDELGSTGIIFFTKFNIKIFFYCWEKFIPFFIKFSLKSVCLFQTEQMIKITIRCAKVKSIY